MKLLNTLSTSSILSLLILGICLDTTITAAFSYLNYEPGENFEECRNNLINMRTNFSPCVELEFTEKEMNETRQMYGDGSCLRCMHICRKKDIILHCVNVNLESTKEVSNKSRTMVPFFKEILEAALSGLCDQNGVFPASNGDEKQCFRKSWSDCTDHLEFLDHLDIVFFCDSANEEKDPFTKEYVCLRLWDHHECMERSLKKSCPDLMDLQNAIRNKLIASESCIKYLNSP
ncbi:uncharacterized protein LOC124154406 [Ischnura elegans]|uniref:uncharacterized protein LOC124154406 n=1 Tax=Ischnura elegans TaxID=197161 RepID=UPI001ED8B5B0|nr:uncharacterized protein LOC124154406 [Ischnura elegans]